MPEIVKELTKEEKLIEKEVFDTFTEEQISVYFLSKNIRSIYQFNDEFIDDWYNQFFDYEPDNKISKRVALALEYTNMLLIERKYENHMKYWIRQMQKEILVEMKSYFSGEGGK